MLSLVSVEYVSRTKIVTVANRYDDDEQDHGNADIEYFCTEAGLDCLMNVRAF